MHSWAIAYFEGEKNMVFFFFWVAYTTYHLEKMKENILTKGLIVKSREKASRGGSSALEIPSLSGDIGWSWSNCVWAR